MKYGVKIAILFNFFTFALLIYYFVHPCFAQEGVSPGERGEARGAQNISEDIEAMKRELRTIRGIIWSANRKLEERKKVIESFQISVSHVKAELEKMKEKVDVIESQLDSMKKDSVSDSIAQLRDEIKILKLNIRVLYGGVIFSLFISLLSLIVGRQRKRTQKLLKL